MPRDKNIFTLNPTSLDMRRSVFPRNSQHKTSFNLGELIPIYFDEILPGDTVSLDFSTIVRMTTPIAPIMDNIHADVYFFFVPNRIVWQNWQQFCGENETTAWTNTAVHNIPVQDIGTNGSVGAINLGSIGDYLGLPIDSGQKRTGLAASYPDKLEVSELPLRGYAKIWNDWFRDENSIAPILYTIGDSSNVGTLEYGDTPFKVSRFHDLFSSCLPSPQKGASVTLPLGSQAPVFGTGEQLAFIGRTSLAYPVRLSNIGTALAPGNMQGAEVYNGSTDKTLGAHESLRIPTKTEANNTATMYADLSQATAATINQLRTAFQVQKLLEKDARGGTRYIELLRAHFGVTSPDARLQRSEYLCGHRFRVNVDQVVATADSGSSGSSIVGQTGAVSKTAQASSMFTKSFVEHGMLLGFIVLRQDHSYSDGLEKYWLKRDRFDFYYPVLANIGEVPVYKSELYAYTSNTPGVASGVFGYQEAWYEYRFKPSRCSAYMNPSNANSLNYWTLGDVYSAAPGLNQTFLEESPAFLDRALTVQSGTMHQFIADFYFKAKFSRVMPLYSIPGLIDHH